MKKYSILILLIFSSHLFAQTDHKSILDLKAESKKLIENSQLLSDSINTDNILNKKHSAGNIAIQTLVGSFFGFGFSFVTAAVVIGLAYKYRETKFSTVTFGVLVPSSLILGSATGVHLVSRNENPKHSFWQTVKYSAYGAGGGVVLSLIFASKKRPISGGEAIIISLTPLIGSMVYSNFIAGWPETNNNNLKEVSFRKMNYTFKDYYESEQLFRINVLSISF